MKDFSGVKLKVKNLLKTKSIQEAIKHLKGELAKQPKKFDLLAVASIIYRKSGDSKQAFLHSKLLIQNHPENIYSYVYAAENLLALDRLNECKYTINEGLQKDNEEVRLINIAIRLYRNKIRDREKSIEYSELLIKYYKNNDIGYANKVEDLVALKRYEEALETVSLGQSRCPKSTTLKKYRAYVNNFLGNSENTVIGVSQESINLSWVDLIAYSSSPKFFKLIQRKRAKTNKDTNKNKNKKQYIFIGGLARSGTTAAGQLLNISNFMEIYTELYPHQFNIEGYATSDFTTERICKRLKNSPHQRNKKIFLRNSNSKVVGDKRPSFQFCAESTFDNFSDNEVKFIFIDRSLIDICRSSHKKSLKLKDKWSLTRGIEHSILAYNASCRQIIHLHEYRKDIIDNTMFPTYEDIFTKIDTAQNILKLFSLDYSDDELDDVKNFIDKSQKYVFSSKEKDESLERYIKKAISSLLDHNIHEEFCSITRNSRSYLFA